MTDILLVEKLISDFLQTDGKPLPLRNKSTILLSYNILCIEVI